MSFNYLIYAIVNHGCAEKLASSLRAVGARGGTILVGRGTRNSSLLRFLSIDDVQRDILLTLVQDDQLEVILKEIKNYTHTHKHDEGIAFVVKTGGNSMNEQQDNDLISVIVNRGFADDVMEAARKAGARGGTILHARGTGKSDDEKFFGITIVPEKEQILILADKTNTLAIQNAIKNLPCLDAPGMGILYTTPVEHFVQLGKNAD